MICYCSKRENALVTTRTLRGRKTRKEQLSIHYTTKNSLHVKEECQRKILNTDNSSAVTYTEEINEKS
jgi:hypothetical protein